MENLNEEEVLNQDTQPTEEELYEAEYNKAWSDEEEELEQPKAEEEADVDEPVEEEVIEDSNEEVEDKPVEETKEEEEEPSEDFTEILKWNGKEIPVTRDELIALGQKGFDSEKKWQDVAAIRPYHDLIKDNNLTVEQVQTLVDIVKGKNPEAVALLAEQNGIDLYEADKKDYAPIVEEKNYALDDVIAEINQNEEVATQMNDYVSSVPQSVKETLISNPQILRGLNQDATKGIAQKIMPDVIKQLVINPNQDFVEVYKAVGNKVFSQEQEVPKEPKATKPVATREDKKRVAISKDNVPPAKPITDDYDKAWDNDEHFEAVKRRLSGF